MKSEKPLVSVIIPVYNVEDYLDRCIKSVTEQTYKNLEIILVDDGSPDGSPEICDEWAQKDSRVKVIHKKNGGVSSARNAALDIAKGDYIAFVDSDDYLESTMYEILLKKAKEYNADVVRCAYIIDDVNDDRLVYAEVNNNPVIVDNKEQMLSDLHFSGHKTVFMCNKLFKRNVLSGLRFNENFCAGEDLLFIYSAYENSNRIVYYDLPLYYYTVWGEQANAKPDFNFQVFRTLDYLTDRGCVTLIYHKYFNFSVMAIHDSVKYNNSNFNIVRKAVLKKKKKIKSALKLKKDKKNYLKLILICYFPKLYKSILKFSMNRYR